MLSDHVLFVLLLMKPANFQKSNRYTVGLDNWDIENWEYESQLRISKIWKQDNKQIDAGGRTERRS